MTRYKVTLPGMVYKEEIWDVDTYMIEGGALALYSETAFLVAWGNGFWVRIEPVEEKECQK